MRSKLLLFVSLILLLMPLASPADPLRTESSLAWKTEEVSLSEEIRLQENSSPKHDTLHLPGGDRVVLEIAPAGAEKPAYESLGEAQKAEIQRSRRDLILAAARTLYARGLSGLSLVSGSKALRLSPAKESLESERLSPLHPVEEALEVPSKEDVKAPGAVKSFLSFLNEAIFLSTYRAGKQHWENRQALKPLVNEFGFQITLKAEFQFGMGRFNITKNLPVSLSFGYNRETRQILIRGGRRIETMNGGTAFSGGVKVELRKYQRISSPGGSVEVKGVSWYPPSIPMLSLVADAAPTYRAAGLVFGVNVADLVPGLYFVNTVNDFAEKEVFVRALKAPALPAWIAKASQALRASPVRPQIVACRAVFAP